MTDLLQQELTRPPVLVTIAGREYPVTFTIAAFIAYKKASGISLFDVKESKSVDLRADPERWLFFLWAGLHQEKEDGTWVAPFTVPELKRSLGLRDMMKIDAVIWSAFTGDMPAEKDPNAEAPAAAVVSPPAPAQDELSQPSDGSGPALVADSASTAPSS